MGSEIQVDAAPEIQVVAGGTDDLAAVVLVRYTAAAGFEEIDLGSGAASLAVISFTDEDLDSDAIYYVRVEQVDGHRAWGSPVWVEFE